MSPRDKKVISIRPYATTKKQRSGLGNFDQAEKVLSVQNRRNYDGGGCKYQVSFNANTVGITRTGTYKNASRHKNGMYLHYAGVWSDNWR